MTSDIVRVRFAPSPTGYFHVGGARTALYNWLFARQHGGKFILRIEDTDRARYQPEALPDLIEALRWLGLCWDEGPEVGGGYGPYYQSDRKEIYQKYAQQLVDEGHAYPCFCSPERLQKMREEQRAAGKPPGYDRHCRYLTRKEIAEYEAQGIEPVIRLAAPLEGTTSFDDLLRGHITVNNRQLDDMILLKSDGFPTYHLANVVDDHLMGITHILRGEEWLSSVPKHVLLYDAFGWEMPVQAHLPTILDPSGEGKLSKRKKQTPGEKELPTFIHEFREAGYLPEAMVNFLALVGWAYDGQTEFFTRDELIRYFDLEAVSKSPSAFSYDKLEHMNATYIRELGQNDLAGRLMRVLRKERMDVDFETVLQAVPLIQTRIRTLQDAIPLLDFFFIKEIKYDPQLLIQKGMDTESTVESLKTAKGVLAGMETFDRDTLDTTLRDAAENMGLGLGPFFGGIRVACTGKRVAPPLFGTLAILGQETVVQRLEKAIRVLTEST
ncbi:MAG: glutamate--tRNA ligase [Chloroflexota bacterium]|nr:glutamate--tRNA ligase [Chloroflexota bacterium]